MKNQPSTLVELLRARADAQPGEAAYTFLADGERQEVSLSYRGLDRRARAVGAKLQAMGLDGERALLLCPPGLEYLEAFFGCLYAGVTPVCAYPPDPKRHRRTLPRLQVMVEDSGASLALTTAAQLAVAGAMVQERLEVSWLTVEEIGDGDRWRDPGINAETLAFLMYTSGSTTVPRGVMVSHGNVMHNLSAFRGFDERPCTTTVSWLPFFHDLGLVFGVLQPLYQGAHAVLMPPLAFLQKPIRWLRAISRLRATTTFGPNFAFELCVRKTSPEQRAGLDLECLNFALNGAEPIRAGTLERFVAAFGPHGFRDSAFYPAYGLSECTSDASGGFTLAPPVVRRLRRSELESHRVVEAAAGEKDVLAVVGCGQILPDQTIRIVDPETFRVRPPGMVGEIWFRGPSVAGGYWQHPQATVETFGARLQPDGEGPYLRTADLGFLDAGELFVTGRLKDMIIVRGINHYSHDIERTVEKSHGCLRPGCGAAFAIDVGDREGLVVVQEVDATRLEEGESLESVLADIHQAVVEGHDVAPRATCLIRPRSLLKTSSGKIQRQATRKAFLAGELAAVAEWRSPLLEEEGRGAVSTDSIVADGPATTAAIRDRLVDYCARKLGLDPQDIDPRQPFARYGMTSVEALQVIRQLESWLQRDLQATLVWDYPNPDALSRHLAAESEAPRIERPRSSPAPEGAEPYAIVGMACRVPGASSPRELWQLLRDGGDAVTEIPADRRRIYEALAPGADVGRRGGFLKDLDLFDNAFFEILPREAVSLDPRQRLTLELAWEALEDAGIPPTSLAGSRTGVFLGVLSDDYGDLMFDQPATVDAHSGTGGAHSLVANRLSYFYDLRGPSLVVDTACSASLLAIHLATESLRSGESTLALIGGVMINLKPDGTLFFSRAGALSPEGRCKPFDASADGFVRSEGAGMIVLKPLSQAEADGDPIYAVVLGSAVNQNGRGNGITAPSGQAQEELLLQAYRRAGVSPGEIQYVEAHGTGTSLGDPIEAKALGAVMAQERPPGDLCAVGSIKSNLGHAEAAAGVIGVIKVALAMKHRQLPPSLHVETPNPQVDWRQLPLRIQRRLSGWPRADELPLAGVSGFGVGGTNAHVVLQGVPELHESPASDGSDVHLLPISAKGPRALSDRVRALEGFLRGDTFKGSPEDLCWTAGHRRAHLPDRLAVIFKTRHELLEQLAAFRSNGKRSGIYQGSRQPWQQRKLVWIFAGQGAAWLGMGRQLLDREPVFREVIEEFEGLLQRHSDPARNPRLTDFLSGGEGFAEPAPAEVVQPATCAVQLGLATLLRSWGLEPEAVAGHSLGEVAAACVCGILGMEDAVRVVSFRSRLMAEAAGQGRTAVVGLSMEETRLLLTGREHVSLAGSNSPTATVISGNPEVLAPILLSLEDQGVFCRLLRGVDVAFHSSQMDPLRPRLVKALEGLEPQAAQLPFYSTVTGDRLDGTPLDAEYWGRNLRQPFLFAQVVERLVEDGFEDFLELGPHSVLASPIRQTLRHLKRKGTVVTTLRRDEDARRCLLSSLGQLYCQGYSVDWRKLGDPGRRSLHLPAYPWQRQRFWYTESAEPQPAPSLLEQHHSDGHPLLGERLSSPLPPRRFHWQTRVSPESFPLVRDHRVRGKILWPAAGFLEMACSAARRVLRHQTTEILDVELCRALVLKSGESRRIQLVASPEETGRWSFQILSQVVEPDGEHRPSGANDGPDVAVDDWIVHVTGVFQATQPVQPEPGRDREPRDLFPERVPGEQHYRFMADYGLEYGPGFQTVEQLQRGDRQAWGSLTLPAHLEAEAERYEVHPALLDGALQLVAAAFSGYGEAGGETRVPVGLDSLTVLRPVGSRCDCWVRLGDKDGPAAGDLSLYDESGRMLAKISGLRLSTVAVSRQPERHDSMASVYQVAWHRAALPAQGGAAAQLSGPSNWIVLTDRAAEPDGIGRELVRLLEEHGRTCWRISRQAQPVESRPRERELVVDPEASESFRDLFRGLPEPRDGLGIVYLWGLDSRLERALDDGTMLEESLRALIPLVHLVQAAAEELIAPQLWVVTRGAHAVAADRQPLALTQAPLWGLARGVGHQEHPELWGGLVDLDPSTLHDGRAEAARLLVELCRGDGEDQVAFRGDQRFVLRWVEPAADRANERNIALEQEASYLITGGLGALGLHVANRLVDRGARGLVLLGRTPLPERSTWAALDAEDPAFGQVSAVRDLEARGARVVTAAVDVADRDQLASFLTSYRQGSAPPICGVIHSAGVLRDTLLLRMTPEHLEAVLRPKLLGAWNLHELLAGEPLDFFVLFSSLASLLVPPGQSNYAAANAFLDALAHHRVAGGQPAVSLNWGPWSGGGMAADLEGRYADTGLGWLSPPQALASLERAMGAEAVQATVLIADLGRLREFYGGRRSLPFLSELTSPGPAGNAPGMAENEDRQSTAGTSEIATRVQELVLQTLSIDSSQLDLDQPLQSLGLDSIMAIELKSYIERKMGVDLPMSFWLKGPSLTQITRKIQVEQGL